MSTPQPRYFCPRCRAAYDVDNRYCGRCGADMHHASRLDLAKIEEASGKGTAPLTAIPRARPATDAPLDRRGGDPWLGRVIDARYRVVDVIGRGGMGVVYRVEHQRMGKVAAMKVLHRELAEDREVIERFQVEADAVSRLTHPNTVQVFDFGVAQGAPYLVMEYVRGLDLGSLIDRDGPLGFERAAPLVAQICAALVEAHELGIVHRDLKPENILVTRAGGDDFVKVLDFGLAKLAEREEAKSVTGRGTIVGTPYYMAPEQIRGEQVDGRTDLYALGALLYRALTGEPAFQATTPVGVLTKHLTEPLVPPSARAPAGRIPPEVDALVARAMAKRAADRFDSAAAMLEEIEQVWAAVSEETTGAGRLLHRVGRLGSGKRAAEPVHPLELEAAAEGMLRRADLDAFERSLRRRRRLGWVALPLLAAAVGGAVYYGMVWRGKQPRRVEVEPNHELAQATPIASGASVTGLVGQRRSRTEGDRDAFRVVDGPAGGGALTATLTGLPNMDLALELVDRAGQLLARVDDGGVGEGERLHGFRVPPGVTLVVAEARPPGSLALPTENVSDRYELVAEVAPLDAASSREPDDTASDANPLAAGARLTGHLERRRDVDLYRFDGAAGRYRVVVEAAPALPVRWSVAGAEADAGGVVALGPGALIRVERRDADGPHGEPPGAALPYTIAVEPAR